MAAAARYDEPKRLKFAFGSSLRSLSYFSEQSGFFRDLIKSHVSDQNMRAFLKVQNRSAIFKSQDVTMRLSYGLFFANFGATLSFSVLIMLSGLLCLLP